MSAEALVRELNALGVYPFVEGGKLKAKALNSEIPADIVDRIRLNKEALIGFLADTRTASLPPAAAIAAGGSDTGRYPLSFSQRRLWFIDQLEGGGSQYNMPTALQLHGDLDADAIEWSLGEIVRRHAVLRSTYANDGGEPVQIVHEPPVFRMRRLDLSSLPPERREEQLQAACREEFERPFDLASDPMLRACAIALQPDHHVLIVNLHHIACDGWSKGVLTRELVELYRDRVQGRGCGLPPLPVQYSDYAQWQQAAEFADRIEYQFAYWQRQLADIPKVHGLRLDKPRPAQQQFAGDVHVQELGAELLGRLNAVALADQAALVGLTSFELGLRYQALGLTGIALYEDTIDTLVNKGYAVAMLGSEARTQATARGEAPPAVPADATLVSAVLPGALDRLIAKNIPAARPFEYLGRTWYVWQGDVRTTLPAGPDAAEVQRWSNAGFWPASTTLPGRWSWRRS